jgi:hypothetical protein
VTTTPEHPEHWPADDFVSTEELARRQDVKPIASIDELAQPDLWEPEEEHEALPADLYASRRRPRASYVVVDTDVASAFFASVVVLPCSLPSGARSRPTPRRGL